MDATFWICETCAVEHADRLDACSICADERQWSPAGGQRWTTLAELSGRGQRTVVTELEPNLLGIEADPKVGIGQQTKVIVTPDGLLVWDPIGFVDDAAVERIRALGLTRAVVASHPHMYGVQVEWSRALGGAEVLVAAADRDWVARDDRAVRAWSGELEILPGVTLSQPGGHFPGSAVVHWAAGAEGRGVLLSSDTVFANPDRGTVAFMRSYPNHFPLSAAVTERVARHLERYAFDRLYGNFTNVIDADARAVVRRSADRHIAWVSGDHDDRTCAG
ncbi:MAG: hydrolase [Thermoleophilia bacterium]|nr:hydrolase [Thermoleophilia bacterium]